MGIRPWREMALGDFVTLQRGHDLPDTQRRAGRVPVMGSFGVTGHHDEAKAKGPGVTVGRSGASFGVVSYCPVDYWPLNTALYVNDFHGNDERFAYYFLKTIDFTAFNSGSAQPSLNRNFIHPIRIRVPEANEQRRIADILGTLDDKIELNRRMNETLEAMARRLFRSWFVDFDPVHAKSALRRQHPKLTNADLSRRALPNMAPEIAELFPDSFEDSTLGPIPKGWKATKWGVIATLEYGKSLSNYRDGNGQYQVYGTNGPIGCHSEPLWDRAGIIIGRKGAYRGVHYSPRPFFVIDTAFYLKPKVDLELRWAYLELRALDINGMDSGSAIPSTSREDFYSIPVRFPTADVHKAFGEAIKAADSTVNLRLLESERLSDMRDKLLPLLLSGRLTLERG